MAFCSWLHSQPPSSCNHSHHVWSPGDTSRFARDHYSLVAALRTLPCTCWSGSNRLTFPAELIKRRPRQRETFQSAFPLGSTWSFMPDAGPTTFGRTQFKTFARIRPNPHELSIRMGFASSERSLCECKDNDLTRRSDDGAFATGQFDLFDWCPLGAMTLLRLLVSRHARRSCTYR